MRYILTASHRRYRGYKDSHMSPCVVDEGGGLVGEVKDDDGVEEGEHGDALVHRPAATQRHP